MTILPVCTELTPDRARIAARLKQEYETHTERLADLMEPATRRRHRSQAAHIAARSAAIVAARHALADVAMALHRLADGTYGRCEACLGDIPTPDLELSPAARWCRTCEVSTAY